MTEEENQYNKEQYRIEQENSIPKVSDYRALRANEYPDIKEYLDGVVKGDQQQIQAYIDACLAIKAKYPKS